MKRLSIILLAAAAFLLSSCLEEEVSVAKLEIQLALPEESVGVDICDVTVRLQNKSLQLFYESHPDASGQVCFEVQPGKYDVTASAYYKSTRVAVNGSMEEFLLTEGGIVAADGSIVPSRVTLELAVAIPNPLVIREFYYHGSLTFEGANYTKDTYVELYNNAGPGGQTIFLDSLCIAAIFPYNSTTGTNAWAGSDLLPVAQMYWMFPGDGRTYPLEPGESVVVAARAAVDHSGRATSGLQLNHAHFGCYSETLSGHEIAAGVVPMVMTMAGQGNAWALSIHSPALVVFKPEMGVAAYRSQSDRWENFEPGKSSGTKYWHIDKKWILDGVECVDSPGGAVKRLPGSVDAAYVYMRSAHYSGKCITRRLEFTENGIDVYQDTNNSDADFIPDSTPSPRLKR